MHLVTEATLPPHSALWEIKQPNDFLDCYSCTSDLAPQKAAEVGFDMPAWTEWLLNLRNTLMRPFGLKTENTDDAATGIFPVISETETELVLGTDDKHLNFRITILQDGGKVFLATWVRPHNWAGHLYLATVMPFHKLISKSTVKRIAKETP